jgi:hypothetical protein
MPDTATRCLKGCLVLFSMHVLCYQIRKSYVMKYLLAYLCMGNSGLPPVVAIHLYPIVGFAIGSMESCTESTNSS